MANNSPNQTIDGAKSFGVYAGSGTGISFRRPISATAQFGTVIVSTRFNVDNTKGFSGFNLKSAAGSGSGGFGVGELVSFGISPVGGNNGILVTDSSGQRVLDLGADVRSTIIDFQVDFDALNRRYVVGAKFRAEATFKKLSGTMSGTGTSVTHIGFANWNSTGSFQDLMFDGLEVRGSSPIGGGTAPIAVNNSLTGLSANTMYHYRAVAMNLDGGTSYGVNTAFFTGTDLSIASSVTGSPWIRGTAGEILLTINNTGSAPSSGILTVTVTLPAGLTVTGISGAGWTASSSGLSCTRADSLGVGLSCPVIALNVAVASNAAETLQPTFTISGAGDAYSANNTITSTITTISPLDGWRSQYFGSSSNSGAAADTSSYTGDGVANLIKYAFGLNPTVPVSGGLPEAKIMNNRLAITFNRMKSTTDIVYEVQASGDLFGWGNSTVIWSSASVAYTGGGNDSESVTVQDTVSTDAANRRFMRLQISRP